MKIKQADLKALKKDGVKVRRTMGKQRPTKEVDQPIKEVISPAEPVKHASMGASMADSASQLEAANHILAMNGAMIRDFAESVKELRPRDPVPYTFDIRRDEDRLLKKIFARPGILEDEI